jgi:methionine-rich copper-binding protein CopC
MLMLPRRPVYGLLFLIGLVALLVFDQPVEASSLPLRIEPADGALLVTPPRQFRVWLAEAALADTLDVQLTDSQGQRLPVAARSESYQPADAGLADRFDSAFIFLCSFNPSQRPTMIDTELPDLQPGIYNIAWRIETVSRHGAFAGSAVFTVQPGATEEVAAEVGSSTINHNDLLVSLITRPNRLGDNFISLQIGSSRRPAAAIDRVMVGLLAPGETAPRAVLPAEQVGRGQFQVAGAVFTQPGNWQLIVQVERQGLPSETVTVPWTIPAAPITIAPWMLLIASIVLVGLIIVSIIRRQRRRIATAG